MQKIALLPEPSQKHATCAWCFEAFNNIVELLDHVDGTHLEPEHPTAGRALQAA